VAKGGFTGPCLGAGRIGKAPAVGNGTELHAVQSSPDSYDDGKETAPGRF
jgi:hypothetical protein